ncbi:MAG: hybrid sensor histidine kinase/response regulator [Phormidesmis sp.]
MAQNLDRQTRLNCLDEINEYFDTIEAFFLALVARTTADATESESIEAEQIDATLRAAHTVKGISAMIDAQALGKSAHRLEDYLKILKARQQSIQLDSDLQTWLLQALDGMRQISARYREDQPVDESWLESHIEPAFTQLHNRLGDLQAQDEALLLAQEENNDVAAVMFESEVDGLLHRLEKVLADPALPCLREEVDIIAQEFISVGQMLHLEAFVELCEAIRQQLTVASEDEVEAIAHQAVKDWRQTQALVMMGRTENLPQHFDVGIEVNTVAETPIPIDLSEQDLLDLQAGFSSFEGMDESIIDNRDEMNEAVPSASMVPIKHAADADTAVDLEEVIELKPNSTVSEDTFPPSQTETAESMVKVPVRLLTHLNDLFGELIIQRKTLNSRLGQLNELVGRVEQQTGTLERIKSELQTFSNRTVIQTAIPQQLFSRNNSQLPSSQSYSSQSYSSQPYGSQSQRNPSNGLAQVFDTLEMDRYSDVHLLSQEQGETVVQLREVTADMQLSLRDIKQASNELERTAQELQINVTRATMRPLSDIVKQFPRLVRDLSLQYGKQVDFQVHGSSTLVDRYILETLRDPLMHLVRNAFDHGIETPEARQALGKPAQGKIDIWATHRSNQTVIVVEDDGAGIDLDSVQARAIQMGIDPELLEEVSPEELIGLIFEPGFSTASEISDLSGRGIGMDVVRTNLSKVRGEIKVNTQPEEGTTFTINVPFTLSTIRAMLVEASGVRMAFPTDGIQEVVRLKLHQVHHSPGQQILSWEGLAVPLIRLDQWLTFNCPRRVTYRDSRPLINEPIALIVRQADGLKGIYVDKFWGEQEIVIRQVEDVIELPSGFIGCTILDDGHAVPLADTLKLLDWISDQSFPPREISRPSLLSQEIRAGLMKEGGAQADGAQEGTSQAGLSQDGLSQEREFRAEANRSLTANGSNGSAIASPSPSEPMSILVVDDSINVRRFLAHTLEQAGYRIEQAKDGREAVDKLVNGLLVQAVLCDIEMPRLDGYGFLAEIKTQPQYKHLPVVMLTSRSGDKHRTLAMNLGAADYFTKPYQDHQLLKALDQLIHQSQSPTTN